MAIAAHLDEPPGVAVKTRRVRRKLWLETRGALASGHTTDVLIHNVSATGLLLESPDQLAAGEKIEIDLPHTGATVATVIWTSGQLFGCQFEGPLTDAALSAAQLRSAVGQDVDLGLTNPPGFKESFGVRLQRLRKERGLTLSQVAAKIGVSKPTVWAWEQGKARPIESRIEALAGALGVTRSELLATGKDASLNELLEKTREKIASAFGTDREKVRIMIDL
jgi:transcriptional regulator with XRE-family HTH domain